MYDVNFLQKVISSLIVTIKRAGTRHLRIEPCEQVFHLSCPLSIDHLPIVRWLSLHCTCFNLYIIVRAGGLYPFLIFANYEIHYYVMLFFHDHQEWLFRKVISKSSGKQNSTRRTVAGEYKAHIGAGYKIILKTAASCRLKATNEYSRKHKARQTKTFESRIKELRTINQEL